MNDQFFSPKPSEIPIRFCWVASGEGATFVESILRQCGLFELNQLQREVVLARAIDSVQRLRLQELHTPRELKTLVLSGGEVWELRIGLGVEFVPRNLRIYLHLRAEPSLAAGLLVRFKRVTGSNLEIRGWQNQDIRLAMEILQSAKVQNFQNCFYF